MIPTVKLVDENTHACEDSRDLRRHHGGQKDLEE